MDELKVPLNQVLAYGVMYQLRYEFTANEGSMLNAMEHDHPEMAVFDLCEDFKKLMDVSHKAISYLMEHEITAFEDVKEFAEHFKGDNVSFRSISNALDFSLSLGWREKVGEIGNERIPGKEWFKFHDFPDEGN